MTSIVEQIQSSHLADLKTFITGLPHLPTDWDITRKHEDRVELQMHALKCALEAGPAWVSIQNGIIDGFATLRSLAWDTEFFQQPMAVCDFLRATNPNSAETLIRKVATTSDDLGIQHVRHVVDVRDHELVHTLQENSWQMVWACNRVVCDTATHQHPPFDVSVEGLQVVETSEEHLPSLLAITEELPRYNWPEFDLSIEPKFRNQYVRTRMRNCVLGDFADLCLTLLYRGNPIGFNASKIQQQPDCVPRPTHFSFERDMFVSQHSVPGVGHAFQKEVVRRMGQKVRYMLGQVRLDGIAMFHTIHSAGFRPWGGNLYMVLRSQ